MQLGFYPLRATWRIWTAGACLLIALAGCGGDDGGSQAASAPDILEVTPPRPLRGESTYGVVLTNGIRDAAGRPLRASALFRTLKASGGAPDTGPGPVALMSEDPEAPGNPYPEARLVRDDGTVRVPDSFALRGVAAEPAEARALLRSVADELETIRGFSTTAPVRIALSAPVDPSTVTQETLLFFERSDGGLDLEGALAEAERRGVARADVVLAFSFPTQPIADDLLAIRRLLTERAAASPPRLALDDEDPLDDLEIGVFDREAPGPFAEFLAANDGVGLVARGLMQSPNFLGADGIMDAERIAGDSRPEDAEVDAVLTIPSTGPPPYPAVILQHGFGGSSLSLLSLAGELAEAGMATIGISAVSHGPRGNPVELLDSTPLRTRDMFRQTNADQMALVRVIEAGIDVDGDGTPELDAERISYLGVSLGGLLGAPFVALESAVQTAVLNVAGGRIAQLGNAPAIKPLYSNFFAGRANLPADSAEFAVVLTRLLELGQQAMDAADGLNYARHWHNEPLGGAPANRVLIQEGIGDDLVLNESTEELAAAAGLGAQSPSNDPAGVCGLWRFDPPDEPSGHGIIGRPEVRAQAVRFLASDGTEISDPASLAP